MSNATAPVVGGRLPAGLASTTFSFGLFAFLFPLLVNSVVALVFGSITKKRLKEFTVEESVTERRFNKAGIVLAWISIIFFFINIGLMVLMWVLVQQWFNWLIYEFDWMSLLGGVI